MTIKSIQKVIKVGSSLAVTIPARDAKAAGIVQGSEVEFQAALIKSAGSATNINQVTAEYEAFKQQYSETLKNLSLR